MLAQTSQTPLCRWRRQLHRVSAHSGHPHHLRTRLLHPATLEHRPICLKTTVLFLTEALSATSSLTEQRLGLLRHQFLVPHLQHQCRQL